MVNTSHQTRQKQERIIEAVRRGLEGDAAVAFLHQEGYATSPAAIARQLRAMGGRGAVQQLIDEGKDNVAILRHCFPGDSVDAAGFPAPRSDQSELFADLAPAARDEPTDAIFDWVKMTLRLPADLHEAIKLAARAEGQKQNDLIVEVLTAYLSRRPFPSP